MADWKRSTLWDLFTRAKRDQDGLEPDVLGFDEETVAEPKTPFWKRKRSQSEVGDVDLEPPPGERKSWFSRRRDDATGAEDETAEPEHETFAEPKTPVWRRTVGGRSDVDDLGEEGPTAARKPWFSLRRREEGDEPDAGVEEAEDETFAEPKAPFWKRNRSAIEVDEDVSEPPDGERKSWFFGRRRGDTADGGFETAEHDEALVEPKAPFWKRRREVEEGAAAEPVPDSEPAASSRPESAAEYAGEPAREETPPTWQREMPEQAERVGSDLGDRAEAPRAPEQAPVWKRDVAPQPEPQGEVADDTGAEAAAGKRKARFFRRRDDADVEPAEPEVEPAAGETKAPFWKRDVGFGRSAEELGYEESGVETPGERKSRFSLRRRAGSVDGDFGVAEEREVTDERTPFWKRSLSFGRSEKDVDDGAGTALEAPYETKSRLSFRGRGGSTTDDVPSHSERKPFWKRDLELPLGRGAGVDAGRPSKSDGGRRKKQELVGLKIGASQIAAAHIANNGSPELLQVARRPIETGIVVGGELRDPEALAEALRDFFDENDLPNRGVRLGIGNNRIGVRSFEITGVHDPSQLENAIRFRAQEALPIPLDEAVLDYQVIDEAVSPTGMRTYRVLLVVAYRELIDRYVAACRGAGLRLAGIDLEAFALLRALLPPSSETLPEDTALVAVSIGHDRSTFAVSNGTVCEFTRVLDWGGAALNTAIARALDLTPSQAEPVKRALTLRGADDATAIPSDDHARAGEAVRLELQSFARELVSSLHFYQNQPGSLAIGSIVLTGGTAHMPGLAAELQRLTGVKVRVGDPLRRVRGGKRVDAPDQLGSFAVAIGLGIED